MAALAECFADIARAEDRLRAERRAYSEAQQFVDESNAAQVYHRDTVLLDVGGRHFRAATSTPAFEGSMLETLVCGPFCMDLDDEGAVFLDRDPLYFRVVLAYLRDPHLPLILPTRRTARWGVAREARYDGLRDLRVAAPAPPAMVPGYLMFNVFNPNEYVTGDHYYIRGIFRQLPCRGLRSSAISGRLRHQFDVGTSTPFFTVGIVTSDRPAVVVRGSADGYFFNGPTSEVWHGDHGRRLEHHDCDCVAVELELDERTLSFYIDSVPFGVAFRITAPSTPPCVSTIRHRVKRLPSVPFTSTTAIVMGNKGVFDIR